mmetsp:Transcript_70083/g.205467  ORF Transcript_70083/g.205467 Transcript_70083/m.205467 type:complete len:167 (-) Transcript_70083:49-549(-)
MRLPQGDRAGAASGHAFWLRLAVLALAFGAADAGSLRLRRLMGRVASGCPEPQPCSCNCFCAPVVYGTPPPTTPPPTTPAWPLLLERERESHRLEVELASQVVVGRAMSAFGEQAMEATAVGDPELANEQVSLGPPPPPTELPPPAVDRSFCPKAAPCNCFCPCRM